MSVGQDRPPKSNSLAKSFLRILCFFPVLIAIIAILAISGRRYFGLEPLNTLKYIPKSIFQHELFIQNFGRVPRKYLSSRNTGLFDEARKRHLFDVGHHVVMLNDIDRGEFYQKAVRNNVKICEDIVKNNLFGGKCNVLDLGAGSGLLSMLTAKELLKSEIVKNNFEIVALEVNEELSALGEQTIRENNLENQIRYVNKLSTKVSIAGNSTTGEGPLFSNKEKADFMVTETFGTTLLGEGALNFVPDTRERLLKENAPVIPELGIQYATLIDVDEELAKVWHLSESFKNSTTPFASADHLRDGHYVKFVTSGLRPELVKKLSKPKEIQRVNWSTDSVEKVNELWNKDTANRYNIEIEKPGFVRGVLLDWIIEEKLEDGSKLILNTMPGEANFARDVAWGQLITVCQANQDCLIAWSDDPERDSEGRNLELLETTKKSMLKKEIEAFGEVGEKSPTAVKNVNTGDKINLDVKYLAKGISYHVKLTRAAEEEETIEKGNSENSSEENSTDFKVPKRLSGKTRAYITEFNEYGFPLLADQAKNEFYSEGLFEALEMSLETLPEKTKDEQYDEAAKKTLTVLDVANGMCLHASESILAESFFAKNNNKTVECAVVEANTDLSKLLGLHKSATDSENLEDEKSLESRKLKSNILGYTPSTIIMDMFLPQERKPDVLLLDMPAAVLSHKAPFATFRHLLKNDLISEAKTKIFPNKVCFEIRAISSRDFADTIMIGNRGVLKFGDEEIDLRTWNVAISEQADNMYDKFNKQHKYLGGKYSRAEWEMLDNGNMVNISIQQKSGNVENSSNIRITQSSLDENNCVFETDFWNSKFKRTELMFPVQKSGKIHALFGRWVLKNAKTGELLTSSAPFSSDEQKTFSDLESVPLARDLYWPYYVKILSDESDIDDGEQDGISVEKGDIMRVEIKNSEQLTAAFLEAEAAKKGKKRDMAFVLEPDALEVDFKVIKK